MKKNILILILFFISFTSLFADTFLINQAKPYNKFEINYFKDETSTLSINQIVNQANPRVMQVIHIVIQTTHIADHIANLIVDNSIFHK